MNRSLVIKIGGSLLSSAEGIISTIAQAGCTALIVPGGGPFAGTVRGLHIDGSAAHWMAIAGMEQYGWYLSSFGIPVTASMDSSPGPRILLPYRLLLDRDPLPHSWAVTSDTISAWVAAETGADLLILKSVDQVRAGGIPLDRIAAPVETDDLDPSFIPFIMEKTLSGMILNGRRTERITGFLIGQPVPGTSFGITI